jgi:hypothetical protein
VVYPYAKIRSSFLWTIATLVALKNSLKKRLVIVLFGGGAGEGRGGVNVQPNIQQAYTYLDHQWP